VQPYEQLGTQFGAALQQNGFHSLLVAGVVRGGSAGSGGPRLTSCRSFAAASRADGPLLELIARRPFCPNHASDASKLVIRAAQIAGHDLVRWRFTRGGTATGSPRRFRETTLTPQAWNDAPHRAPAIHETSNNQGRDHDRLRSVRRARPLSVVAVGQDLAQCRQHTLILGAVGGLFGADDVAE
jgi:hypothetical protein